MNGAHEEVDVRILHVEITQGLQVHDNSLPLVAGKPTVVRVIPRVDSGEEVIVDGELYAFSDRDLVFEGPIESSNGPLTVGKDTWRGDPACSLDFLLEPEWYEAGNIQLLARVVPQTKPDGTPVSDPNWANNYHLSVVRFLPGGSMSLRYVVVNFKGTEKPTPRVKEMRTVGFLRSVMPMDPLELSYEPAYRSEIVFHDSNEEGLIDDARLIVELNKMFLRDPRAQKLYGWTKGGTYVFKYGGRSDPIYADGQGNVAFGNDTGDEATPSKWQWRRTLAHEIGHNTNSEGLHHPPVNPRSSRYFPSQLQDDELGYDVLGVDPHRRRVMRDAPNGEQRLYDVMVPGKRECDAWIGPKHYAQLFEACAAEEPASDSETADEGEDDETVNEQHFLVQGVIRLGGRAGDINGIPFVHVTDKIIESAKQTPRGSGVAEVRFRNDEGTEVGRPIGWSPRFKDAEGRPVDAWFGWVTVVPEGAKRIDLTYSGHLLGSYPPIREEIVDELGIEILSAEYNAGALRVEWTTTGFSEGIYFQIYYTDGHEPKPDGEGPQTDETMQVTHEMPSPPEGSYAVVTISRGIGEKATDSVLIVRDASEPGRELRGRIISPEPLSPPFGPRKYYEGEHILLLGYASSKGKRVSADIAWQSADKCLGTGEKAVYRKGDLALGIHQITMEVAFDDIKGESGTVEIEVVPNARAD